MVINGYREKSKLGCALSVGRFIGTDPEQTTSMPMSKIHKNRSSLGRVEISKPLPSNGGRFEWSDKSLKKLSKSLKRYAALHPWSKARRRRHSKALMGHEVSKTTRDKLSERNLEHYNRYGLPPTFSRKNIKWSRARRKSWSEFQTGKHRKKHTLATRQLMSRIARSRRPIKVLDESKLARARFEYKIWRDVVYTRDNYTCQKCHIRGGILHPHHIQNFYSHPEIRYKANNGVTLCVICHKAFHKLYGKKHNDKIQLDTFLCERCEPHDHGVKDTIKKSAHGVVSRSTTSGMQRP